MKKKLVEKTYFSKGKLIISYLLLVLLLNGCSKNDSIEVLTQDETINSSFVNFNEFENAVGKDVIAIVTKRIAFHNTKKFSGKNAFSNYLVDTDKIVKSTKGSYVSYTFPVISKNSEKEILKNIIFEKENDDFKAYLLTYKPDLQYITNKKKHKRVKFSGILIKQDLDSNLIWEADISNYEAKSNYKSKTSDCDIFIREFWETGSGEICEFDGQGIDCDEVGCHEVIEITIWCHGGGGDNGGSDGNNDGDNSGGNNDGGMTGGGGGNDSGGSGSGGNSTITTPINPNGTSAVVDILTNFLLLTPEQSNYLTNNTTIANEIFDFLEQNSSIDNKNFAVQAIDILRFPLINSTNTSNYENDLRRMIKHLRDWGNPEDEFFADYLESFLPDLYSMTLGDVIDIHRIAKEQVNWLTLKYLEATVVPFAEAAYPFIVYAATEATIGAAIPLISRIPISIVTQGARLNKMVKQVGLIGVQGTSNSIRIVTTNGNAYTKALELFTTLTKNAQSVTNYTNGTKVALFSNGNKIVFRTQSSSGFAATL